MTMNAREAMHLIELRTGQQGHPTYRRVCQDMHRLIADQAGHRADRRADAVRRPLRQRRDRASSASTAENRSKSRRAKTARQICLRRGNDFLPVGADLRRHASHLATVQVSAGIVPVNSRLTEVSQRGRKRPGTAKP